ncbi:MAG: damage-inducible protein DinB [Gammaproteobacteria bacterium]|nr:MAG: damage-inducible protein DinB [Gammaproteobacteria bacterium]
MLSAQTAHLFARYRAWADALTYRAVEELPTGEGTKLRSTEFKSIIGTLNHIYVVDRVWQAHIEGRDHGFQTRNLIVHEELAALRSAQEAMNQWWIDWVGSQTDATLGEPVRFRFMGGDAGEMSGGAILMHVVNHATYHRGWIAEMFFEVPARNPTTDFPVFMRELARPEG